MRWLRLFAVLVWLIEMAATWVSINRYYRYPTAACQPAWFKRQAGRVVADCRFHSEYLMHNARLVFVVCTATTLAVLLLTWLPLRTSSGGPDG